MKNALFIWVIVLSPLIFKISEAQPIEQDVKFANFDFENSIDPWYFWQKTPNAASYKIIDDSLQPGNKCAHISVAIPAEDYYHVQLQQGHFTIKKNHMYKVTFRARGINGAKIIELVFVKGSPPWTLYSSKKVKLTDKWNNYEMTFTSPYSTRDIHFAFQCAVQKGDYFIDDIAMTEDGVVDINDVAENWYTKVDSRIDSLRKKQFTLSFIDKNGKAVKGTCEIHHLRHDFPFGTCINFSWKDDDVPYKKILLKYFNAGVFENAFKWEEYEQIQGKPDVASINKYLKWSSKYIVPLRGHALVWGIEKYGYNFHWSRQKDDTFLRNSIKNRISRDCATYKGQIKEYDVWNEPIHETAFFDRLGYDILDSTFVWADRADPDAKLFINEYAIIEGTDFKVYRDLISDLLKRGVPVDGIGVQGHFSTRIDPLDIASKLDYLAQTGLPIKITEFDMDITGLGMTDQEMASDYVKMLRTAFSHPSVTGFMFWGFWDARHWRPGAGLYTTDLKPKPAADSVYNLINNVWSTDTTITTDGSGNFLFRGFTGEYELVFRSVDNKKARIHQNLTSEKVVTINVK
jgi:endo-1,4-beta-xylanase